MMVILIALLHAVFVVVIAAITKSKLALVITAIVVGIFGVATGNPAYMIADLMGVAFGYWLSLSLVKSVNSDFTPQREIPDPAPKKRGALSWLGVTVTILILLYFYKKPTYNPTVSQSTPPIAETTRQVSATPKSKQPIPAKRPSGPKNGEQGNKSSANSELSHCFSLPTDAEALQCLK